MWKNIFETVNTCADWCLKLFRSILETDAKRRRVRLIALVICLSFIVVVTSTVKLIYDYSQIHHIRIATGAPGSEYYTFGQAIKKVVETHQSRIRIDLITDTDGSFDNVRKLQRKKVDLALAQNDTPAEESIRSIALLFPEAVHLYVRANNDIEQLGQLRNIHIATLPKYSGTYCFLKTLLEHYNLKADDGVKVSSLRPEAAHGAFLTKEVDGVFHIIALGSTAKEYIGSSLKNGAQLLPIEQVGALKYDHPFLKPYIIPKGFYRGYPPLPEHDIPTAAVHAVLLAHKGVDEGLVYEITRTLHEHRNELVQKIR